MRRAIVISSWLLLLWLGLGLGERLAPGLVPASGLVAGGHDEIDGIDWTLVQDPLETPLTRRALQSSFLGAPLSARPFAIRLVSVSVRDSGHRELRRELGEHIRRIAPRNVTARLTLAELDYLDGQYKKTADGISQLMVLDRSNANTFLDVLASMAVQDNSRPAIMQLLGKQPAWGSRLISKLAGELGDKDFLIELAQNYPSSQSAVVRSLVTDGDLDRAYVAFLDFLDPSVRSALTIPFNGEFLDLAGAQPFNWRINRSFASLEQRGGLAVSFFGQGRPWIAEQTIKLSSGEHRARFIMQGDLYRGGGSFEWSLQCLEASEPLMLLPVSELAAVPEAKATSFSVPAKSCDFQLLRLSGIAGEFPRTARATVSEVAITPVAGTNAP